MKNIPYYKQLIIKARKIAGGSMLRLYHESGVPIASLWRMWAESVKNPKQENIDLLENYINGRTVD